MSPVLTEPRPRIGIDIDHEHDGRRWIYKLPTFYLEIVKRCGGQPVLIAPGDPRPTPEILADLDGLLMTGGDDIHPAVLGRKADGMPLRLLSSQRERFVLALAAAVLESAIPCLAVCLGCQALNVASGGELYFDLYSEHEGALEHRAGAEHEVVPEPGGQLARWWKNEPQRLVSHHHQAVRRVGENMQLEASANDRVIEAFSDPSRAFLLAVQWHPEMQSTDPGGDFLVRQLVDASRAGPSNSK